MAKLLKLRRGTTSEHSSFTGAEGEVTVDTTKDTLVVHDGSTAGGVPLAKESDNLSLIDEDNMSTDSATRPPSQQSVKAYVDGKVPTTITVADESSDTSCNVAYFTAATGDLAPKTGTNLTFNSNTGLLTATSLAGSLTTAAQTAVTSVGTLTGLGIDGQYIQQEETLTVSSNATTVDCSTGNYFTVQAAGNITFTFGTAPADTKSYAMVIEVDHNSGTLTWPASVKWPADTAPTLTTGKTHQFYFHTNDGGTRWRGASLVDYVD